jgi:hypothetical protein
LALVLAVWVKLPPGTGWSRTVTGCGERQRMEERYMRKFVGLATAMLGLLTFAAVALAGEAGPSPSGQVQTLEVSQSPNKASSKRKKVGTKVKVVLTLRKADGSKASPTTRTIVNLPKGIGLHYRDFKICNKAKLEAQGPKGCPSGTKVGTGSLEADARPVVAEPVKGTVTAFNGNGQTLLLYVVPELSSPLVIPGKLKGSKLDFVVPLVPTLPGQPNATLTRFEVTVGGTVRKKKGGRKVKINYIDNPTSCSGGFSWKFDFTYENGETLSPTDSAPCSK